MHVFLLVIFEIVRPRYSSYALVLDPFSYPLMHFCQILSSFMSGVVSMFLPLHIFPRDPFSRIWAKQIKYTGTAEQHHGAVPASAGQTDHCRDVVLILPSRHWDVFEAK